MVKINKSDATIIAEKLIKVNIYSHQMMNVCGVCFFMVTAFGFVKIKKVRQADDAMKFLYINGCFSSVEFAIIFGLFENFIKVKN